MMWQMILVGAGLVALDSDLVLDPKPGKILLFVTASDAGVKRPARHVVSCWLEGSMRR